MIKKIYKNLIAISIAFNFKLKFCNKIYKLKNFNI